VHWSDFQNVRPLVAEGERAAQQMLPQILQLFERKQSIWRRLFGS
jgi:hypothetical protein